MASLVAEIACWKLRITGRVQGVGYRASARHEARRLGLSGIARNLPDGSVEVLVEADAHALAALERWCRRGPAFASVQDVTVERLATSPGFTGFQIE